MAQLTEHQLARKDAIDTVRTIVRLKHRIAMRRELNEIEDDMLKQIDERAAKGLPFRVDTASLVAGEIE